MGRKKKASTPVATEAAPPPEAVKTLDTPISAVVEEPLPEPLPPTGMLVVTEHGTVEKVVAQREPSQFYSGALADEIHDLYVGGMSLHKIAQVEGMPSYGSILRWYKENQDFRQLIDTARSLRAIYHEERALEVAENADSKDDVPAARLKFDAHVWAAEVNDPAKYGKKTTVQGNPDRPIVFQISTGVPDNDTAKTIELNSDGTVKEVSGG
jgi:hypothetical protein